MTEIDTYAWWRSVIGGDAPPIHADKPECGYFKLRDGKDGPWRPVAIWKGNDGKLVCRVADKMREPSEVWTYVAKNPIAKDIAKHAFETGRFPDEVPAMGDNAPPDESLFERIARVAADAVGWLHKHGIKDARSKDMCANYRAQLLDLRKRADAERETEKRPHLEASRAVDAKFKPLIEEADAAANELRDALTVYMRQEEAELRAKQEAERKIEAERIAVENKRLADERAKLMRDDPIAAYTSPEPEQLSLAPAEPVKVQAGGQRGRKTGLRTVTKYVVRDYAAALEHCKDHPRVREAVETVACAQAKTGASVPGVETVVEKVAA